jgi:hypothetical protein
MKLSGSSPSHAIMLFGQTAASVYLHFMYLTKASAIASEGVFLGYLSSVVLFLLTTSDAFLFFFDASILPMSS